MKSATPGLWLRTMALCAGALILSILPTATAIPVTTGADAELQRLVGTQIEGENGPAEIIAINIIDPVAHLAQRSLSKREIDVATMRPQLGPDYLNATYVWNPIGVQITTAPVSLSNDTGLDKRQLAYPCGYTTQSFISFWSGEWRTGWRGHCHYFAYSRGEICTWEEISETTTFSVSLAAAFQEIITLTLGVSRTITTTKGRSTCVFSEGGCGCQRLWTSDLMSWHHGTHYTDWYQASCVNGIRYGVATKYKTDRIDNIHVDAGVKDPNGFLVVIPGGSPCSDGPSECSVKDWGCPV